MNKRAGKGRSPTGERKGGRIRIVKESERVIGAHPLASGEGSTSQDSERKPAGEGHAPTASGERRRMDMSGHKMKVSGRSAHTGWRAPMEVRAGRRKRQASEALTSLGAQMEGQLRTAKKGE